MTWVAVGAGTATLAAGLLGGKDESKSGATAGDINRARDIYRRYMDWGQTNLFNLADTTAKNREKSANKLFQLQDLGMQGGADMLQQGYANAQARQGLTTMAARNARLGLAPDDRYLAAMGIDPGGALMGISNIGLPDLEFEKGKLKPAGANAMGGAAADPSATAFRGFT